MDFIYENVQYGNSYGFYFIFSGRQNDVFMSKHIRTFVLESGVKVRMWFVLLQTRSALPGRFCF